MSTAARLIPALVWLWAGCDHGSAAPAGAGEIDGGPAPDAGALSLDASSGWTPPPGIAIDGLSRAVVRRADERLELARQRSTHSLRAGVGGPREASEGDWNYRLDGPVNGAVAIYKSGFFTGGATRACSDRLFVPVNRVAFNNLVAFDNLYPTSSSGASCTNSSVSSQICSPSPIGNHCPRLIWTATLDGALDRSSPTLHPMGTYVYATTTTGRLYAVNAATGAIAATFNARTDTGTSDASFEGSAPWYEYSNNYLYVAVTHTSRNRIRVYKLQHTGASFVRVAFYDIGSAGSPEGIRSSVVYYEGAVYLGSTTGRVHKVVDAGTSLTAATSPWPIQLRARDGSAYSGSGLPPPNVAAAFYTTPTIDAVDNILFASLNNVLWSIRLADGATSWVEMGWQSTSEAAANNTPCYSSPSLDLDTRTVFFGHGKDQGGASNRVHRRLYGADGALVLSGLTSIDVLGQTTSDLSEPHSSPLVVRPGGAGTQLYVYVGDGGGNLNRWNYSPTTTNFTNRTTFTASGSRSGPIRSPVVLDAVGANLYFGNEVSSTRGFVFQISQTTLQ